MHRIVDLIDALETYIAIPEHQPTYKELMGGALLRESVVTIPLLIELFKAVEAADNLAWKCVDHEHYHIIDRSWDKVVAALKAIREAE